MENKSIKEANNANDLVALIVDILLKLGALFFVLGWCFTIVQPFITILVWSAIISITLYPMHKMLQVRLGESPKLAAILILFILLAFVIVPTYFLAESMVEGIQQYSTAFTKDSFVIPPPPIEVSEWPVVGNGIYGFWKQASENIGDVLITYKSQLATVGTQVFKSIMSTSSGIIQLFISFIVAGFMLALSKNIESVGSKFFTRLLGNRGDEFIAIAEKTIRNVSKGVVGVAIIQSIAIGIVFLIAGVPYAGLWALVCLILCMMQVGPGLVVFPVVIYLFTAEATWLAVLYTVVLVSLTLLDNVLKPIFMGKGSVVPVWVIFLGSTGGFFSSGFLGMFIGAIVLSLGYKLYFAWLDEGNAEPTKN